MAVTFAYSPPAGDGPEGPGCSPFGFQRGQLPLLMETNVRGQLDPSDGHGSEGTPRRAAAQTSGAP